MDILAVKSLIHKGWHESAANGRLVYGSSGPVIPETWLFQTCLEVQSVRFHTSTVQHNLTTKAGSKGREKALIKMENALYISNDNKF
ncbi:hypothetical protein T10_2426 [Trichinella papuae]|uniref:Uncharacterized protein n=1 Tax=Trichinella papuae TaxID=268474 RepID=A0A0V1ME73_9BILA|nr:hypothetical protein T10_2426 [Trichinella papuae]